MVRAAAAAEVPRAVRRQQLLQRFALAEPATHDMPGVVSLASRERALLDYPDPRLVAGPLY